MFIEVLHDSDGKITACYCADTLPIDGSSPIISCSSIAPGLAQCRVNIDTLTAMEIEAASGVKAEIDPATGRPVIVNVDRAAYITRTFGVDASSEIPSGGFLPQGMKLRRLVRKA
ncbi:MAG: hypothetical protein HY893_03550 [Deltaproteobacteria bacterium]|nr:hypothetical protein [Deltaproteobacteria bacterium]